MTKQRLSVQVPFSATTLQLGDSVGGPGASLVTAQAVLLDAVGVMDIQSQADWVGQTNADMRLLSSALQRIHSQGKVEVYAGGGNKPGDCGGGTPAGQRDTGKPGAVAEVITNTACAGLSGVKAWQDLSAAATAGGQTIESAAESGATAMSALKGLADLGKAAAGPFGSTKGGSVLAGGFEAASGGLGALAGALRLDFGAVASGVSSMIGGGAAAAGGGGADIVERASANIKMVAGKKISGTAPLGIDFKTPGKLQVKALLVTDFTTVCFSNYALAKFEVKSLYQIKTTSSTFEIDVKTAAAIDTKTFTGKAVLITEDGVTRVTKTLEVAQAVKLADTLTVDKDATLEGKLTVRGAAHVHGKLTVEQDVTVKTNISMNKKVKTKDYVAKSRVTFLPG